MSVCDNSVEKLRTPQEFSSAFGIVSWYGRFIGARAPKPSGCNRCNAMLAKDSLLTEAKAAASAKPEPVAPASTTVSLPGSEVAELVHLARAVLMKSPDDLAALSHAAPSMPKNWIDAFMAERARAEAEAKFWSTAITYLMATSPNNIANDG